MSAFVNERDACLDACGHDCNASLCCYSDHHLHLRATGVRGNGEVTEGLWRISLQTIDGWTLRATADAEADKGPFARLLGNP